MPFNSSEELQKKNNDTIQDHTSDLLVESVILNTDSTLDLFSLSSSNNNNDLQNNKKFDNNSKNFISTKFISLFSPRRHSSKQEFTRKEKYLVFAVAAISQIM